MIEAVALGVRGVLLPWQAFWEAGIDAAAAFLGRLGLPAETFQHAAKQRLVESGPRGLIPLALKDLELAVPSAVEREAVVSAQSAMPRAIREEGLRERLRDLAARVRLGFLDDGHPDVLQQLLTQLELDSLAERILWTHTLGRSVAPPRAFGFRWLAEKFGLRPGECLHVPGEAATRLAARRAGWRVWPDTVEAGERPYAPALPDWSGLFETLDESRNASV